MIENQVTDDVNAIKVEVTEIKNEVTITESDGDVAPAKVFNEAVVCLLTYPPPPQTDGVPITNEDESSLNEGEFLNDVIIDFYLKYLMNEILPDKEKTFVFSSLFYKRLTQEPRKGHWKGTTEDDASQTTRRRRHSRVQTWTRNVDLFSKVSSRVRRTIFTDVYR
jgi:Ulp1 family protease